MKEGRTRKTVVIKTFVQTVCDLCDDWVPEQVDDEGNVGLDFSGWGTVKTFSPSGVNYVPKSEVDLCPRCNLFVRGVITDRRKDLKGTRKGTR